MKLDRHLQQPWFYGTTNYMDELGAIFKSYQPGQIFSFQLAMIDVDGGTFLAHVHYRLGFFGHVRVQRVECAKGCDLTLCAAIQRQMPYLTARAELDAQGRTLGDGPISNLQFASSKTNMP